MLYEYSWKFFGLNDICSLICFVATRNLSTITNFPNDVVAVKLSILTLFLTGGGHYGPDDRERPRWFRRVRATTTKIPDFVSVYVWMVPWKSFLGFVFKIFEKRKKIFLTISTSKGPPFGKKIENFQKPIFFQKIILFSFWICIVHVLSFLLRYITLMYLKISNFDLYSHEKFHFSPLSFDSQHGQNCNS